MFCFYFSVRQLLNKYLTKSKTDKAATYYTLKMSVVTIIRLSLNSYKAATYYTLKMSVVTIIRLSLNSYKFIHHAQPCLARFYKAATYYTLKMSVVTIIRL